MIETFLVVLWALLEVVFIAVVALLLIAAIILLLHPIVVESKVRASFIGQKYYIKLRYLFNIIAVEFEGTKHNHKTYLRIFSFRKLLNEKRRFKPKKNIAETAETETPEMPFVDSEIYSETQAKDESKIEAGVKLESNPEFEFKSEFDLPEPTDSEHKCESAPELLESPEPDVESPEPNVESPEPDVESPEPNVESPEPDVESPEPVVESPEPVVESPDKKQKTKDNDFKFLLRNLKKKLNSKITEFRKQTKLFIKKWNVFWPVIKRLFKRGKKFIRFEKSDMDLWYALPEPHLTGMLYGVMAILCDATKRIGITFSFTPVFNKTTFYAILDNRIVLRPFYLVYALFMLIFEFSIYKECYSLYKSSKNKKNGGDSQKK
ncbi:MAG: hypothetical protein ACOX2I_05420 [Candidatus Ozemobacteraceae bacterium]|jgi:hypothetical protein